MFVLVLFSSLWRESARRYLFVLLSGHLVFRYFFDDEEGLGGARICCRAARAFYLFVRSPRFLPLPLARRPHVTSLSRANISFLVVLW